MRRLGGRWAGWRGPSFEGHGFSSPFFPLTGSTAMVPPLFPYLVAAMFQLFGLYTAKAAFAVLSINSLFSALTCIPLYFSARYALGEKAAAMAGWGWVIYPYAIYFSGARVWDYALTGSAVHDLLLLRAAVASPGETSGLAGVWAVVRSRGTGKPIGADDVSSVSSTRRAGDATTRCAMGAAMCGGRGWTRHDADTMDDSQLSRAALCRAGAR